MRKIEEPFHGAAPNRRHIPDHFQRLDTTIRWMTEHGYAPVFFHEGFLGGPE